jgi:hypothetical protein
MKKIFVLIISILLFTTVLSCSAQVCKNSVKIEDEWSGQIRIEGKEETVFKGIVTVVDSNISARNVDTGETENYYIPYPSVLGAVDEASKIDGFSYSVEYWPAWNAFIIVTIEDDSDWWHYWVDYNLPMVDVGTYNLTNDDNSILVGYLESWEAHALKSSVDKHEVYVNEEFTVSVKNESDKSVEGATVFVGAKQYTTNNQGKVKITITEKGNYKIYSEKDGFVRSDKVEIIVKNSRNTRNLHFFIHNFKIFLFELLSN